MRDRLIELLKAPHKAEQLRNMGIDINNADPETIIADYLLANGIIAPPCKVGDTIYMPWKFDGVKGIAYITVTHIIIDGWRSFVRTDFSTDSEEYYELCNGGNFYFTDFGKTVFITRNAAEKALAEGENGT